MSLTNVLRARVILDLLKDGDVSDEAAYNSIDKAGVALATKYVSLWPGESAEERADNMLNDIKIAMRVKLIQAATNAAYSAASASATSEAVADLG